MNCFFILLTVASTHHIISTQSDVRLPPSITKWSQIKKMSYVRDGNFTLTCSAEGTPAVSCEWKKNGVELNTNLSSIRKGSDGTITINKATETDEGYYQCFAKNQYGTALSNMVDVRMSFIEPIAGPPTILQKTVVEGMPFHIQADRRRSSSKLWFQWYTTTGINAKYDPLYPSKRIGVADNGDLHFAYALPEDDLGGRIYACKVYEDLTLSGCYTKLTVERHPEGSVSSFAPELGFSSKAETEVNVGAPVQLRCFFYGFPQPNISWIGPGETLPTGRYSLFDNNMTLYLIDVTGSDEGNYSCTASNTQGNNTQTLQIRVIAAPEFKNTKDGPQNVNITERESVTFHCNAFAIPKANIVWLQDGYTINANNPPERFAFSNDLKSLTIRDVCRDCVDGERKTDLMVIQCNASNIHGYAFASGYLNVLMKTKVTIKGSKNVSVDFREEKEFVFRCDATSDPSTPPTVRWYKTEPYGDLVRDEPPYIAVKEEWLVIAIDRNCSAGNCTKYLGEYRCIGHNKYSQDNRTITLFHQDGPLTGEVTQKDGMWIVWKTILVAGAIGLVLFVIGIFLGVRSKRNVVDINRRTKQRRMPDPPSMHERAVDLPLETLENNERLMPIESYSMYEYIGYDTIADVMEEIGSREGATLHSSDAPRFERSESIDTPQKETISIGEDTVYDDRIDQQQSNGHEPVTSEFENFPKSKQQSESMNPYSDLSRKDINPYLDLERSDVSPREVDPYLDLNLKEANPYLDLKSNEVNLYLDLGQKEMDSYLYMGARYMDPNLDLVPKEMDTYLDMGAGNMDPNLYMTEDPVSSPE